jgi:hypothetical protein
LIADENDRIWAGIQQSVVVFDSEGNEVAIWSGDHRLVMGPILVSKDLVIVGNDQNEVIGINSSSGVSPAIFWTFLVAFPTLIFLCIILCTAAYIRSKKKKYEVIQ